MDTLKLKDILKNAGVAGAGGAGFPAYGKVTDKADTLILNCAECEPLLKLHRLLLENEADKILKALSAVRETIGAKEFVVAVKGSYTGAVNAVKKALSGYPDGRLHILREVYPSGDEVILVYDVTGKIVPAGGIPISVGCVVHNVETMYNIYRAIFEGAPVTHKFVTVAGEVKNPGTFYAPIGTSFSDLIALAGGKTAEKTEIISGGPMTGMLSNESACVTKTTNAILVMPEDHNIIRRRKENVTLSVKRAMSVCCQCRTCTDLCPRHLLGQPIDPAAFMRCIASGDANVKPLYNALYCASCGVCQMYSCPHSLSPSALLGIYKGKLRKNGLKPEPVESKGADPDREYKLVPMARLVSRLNVGEYNVPAPLYGGEVKPSLLKIKTSQSIGAPSVPVVKAGDSVKKGDLIAAAKENALSLPIHSPVDGVVDSADEKMIVIKQ